MTKKQSTTRKMTKTAHMRYLEFQYGKPIEVLLTENSLRHVATKLGVSHTTVANWMRRLNLTQKGAA